MTFGRPGSPNAKLSSLLDVCVRQTRKRKFSRAWTFGFAKCATVVAPGNLCSSNAKLKCETVVGFDRLGSHNLSLFGVYDGLRGQNVRSKTCEVIKASHLLLPAFYDAILNVWATGLFELCLQV